MCVWVGGGEEEDEEEEGDTKIFQNQNVRAVVYLHGRATEKSRDILQSTNHIGD